MSIVQATNVEKNLFIVYFGRLDEAEHIEFGVGEIRLDDFGGFNIIVNAFIVKDSADIVENNRFAVFTVAALGIRLKRVSVGVDTRAGDESVLTLDHA